MNIDNETNFESEESFYDGYEKENEQVRLEEEKSINKRRRRNIIGIICIILLILLLGFLLYYFVFRDRGGNDEPVIVEKEITVSLNKEELSLTEGDSEQLILTITNGDNNEEVTWTSSNSKIATVSEDGLVKAISEGKCNIIVSIVDKNLKNYEKECVVTVNKKENNGSGNQNPITKKNTKLTLSETSVTTLTGKKVTVTVKVNANGTLNVSSGNSSVASVTPSSQTVSANSEVPITINGLKEGESVITIKFTPKDTKSYNGSSATYKVKVNSSDTVVPTCSIALSDSTSGKLTATYNDNVGVKYYGWNSDYSSNKTNTTTITSSGTFTFYVSDNAGNKGKCSIKIDRVANRCKDAGCEKANMCWQCFNDSNKNCENTGYQSKTYKNCKCVRSYNPPCANYTGCATYKQDGDKCGWTYSVIK